MIVGATILAGCVSDSSPAAAEEDPFEQATQDSNLATIQGIVSDPEGYPVAGATVALAPGEVEQRTTANGSFRFVDVNPAVYTLIAQRLGYESAAVRVDVNSGQTAQIDIILEPIRIVESFYETVPFRGVLTCSFSTAVWVSPCDYPYTAVYYTLHDNGVNMSNYGAPAEPLENEWRFNTPIPLDTVGVWSELIWDPTSEASNRMMLAISCSTYDPVVDDCSGWGHNTAGSAPVIRKDWEFPKDAYNEAEFMTRIYLPWGDTQVALDQKYEVYHTFFWGDEDAFPDEFTILPE